MEKERNELEVFVDCLKSIGIHLELVYNLPWVYLISVNGITVSGPDHYFTIAMHGPEDRLHIVDKAEIFGIISKTLRSVGR